MNQLHTTGIILTRIDYGEADRIITLLTPDYGKLRLMAKGVRRVNSKLAGGIELFSVSNVNFIKGRGEIGTLVSTRLLNHYGSIIQNIERVQLGYELIKILNKITQDALEEEYFTMLEQTFAALDDQLIDSKLIECWFYAQLLTYGGFTPNLSHDVDGTRLAADKKYTFDFDDNAFFNADNGKISVDDIKFLRLVFSGNNPKKLHHIQGISQLLPNCLNLTRVLFHQHLQV